MNLRRLLEQRLGEALARAGAPAGSPALVKPAGRPEFGHYQANGVMAAAKRLKTNPRELAEKALAAADLTDLAEKVEVAGPGFLNIHLRGSWLAEQLGEIAGDDRLGVADPRPPQTIVVDYAGPNLAKEMHVGHLRSTIIGDALARTLEFLGHRVVRQNHPGDWGTQFGMLIALMESLESEGPIAAKLADLEAFYVEAKRRFDADPAFADEARQCVVKLQSGDPRALEFWRRFIDESLRHCREVYDALGVSLTDEDLRPESAYNDDLPLVVEALRAAGLLTESRGARCVFLDEFTNKDGDPLPVIVQKSDGGFLYATTDLAAVRHRAETLAADRILYVTDSRQALHFKQIFAVARAAGFVGEQVSLEHLPFGTVMGDDSKPFKTRTGGTVKLMDLLAEAERRAADLVAEKNPDLPEDQRREIARAVGIGAVKYADLAHNRASDYVFSWEKMLALDGNTAPYMQYAYARIRSIFRKAGAEADSAAAVTLDEPAEQALAVKLLQLPETLEAVAAEGLPSLLCGYLFDLAGAFMSFYETCPVLKAAAPLRASRLRLCDLTARTVRQGLALLGIDTLEQM